MDSPTEDLATFVSALDMGSVSPALCGLVSQHVLDVLAGVYASMDIPEAASVATIMGSDNAAAAGRIAMLSHAAESDPIHAGTTICAGLIAVPPALLFSPDGATAAAAVLAGYETVIRIGEALGSSRLLGMGWWPTAVLGAAGAASATARARGLNVTETRNAIALALIQAGGLGTGAPHAPESRNLLAANCVRTGVEAADAAARGIAGPPEPLTGDRAFLSAFGLEPSPDLLLKGLGDDWKITATSLKAFPCALQAQSALAALSDLVSTHQLTAEDIVAIEISLPEAMRRIVDRPDMPETRFGAAASLQFLAAACLMDGDVLPARMAENRRRTPEIRAAMDKVRVIHAVELDAALPAVWPARVRVTTINGEFTGDCRIPPGHPEDPVAMTVTIERFRAYSDGQIDKAAQDRMVDTISDLANQTDMTAISVPLRALS
jgi:2-methylcitrate dehydratase PrpD